MATYRDTLVKALLEWPGLFLNEDDVLDQMFLTVGGGFEWENGQLVEDEPDYHPDPRLEAERADPWTTRLELREYRERCSKYSGMSGNVYFQMKSGHIGRTMTNLFGECSPLCDLPDDIQPDWLEAAKRALRYARSNRMRTTRAQKAWLVAVSVRIKELELSRKPEKKSSRKKAA